MWDLSRCSYNPWRHLETLPGPDSQGAALLLARALGLYLGVVHEDLCCHAHLQHAVDDQLAVGRQQVPARVDVVQPVGVLTHWSWKS